MSKNFKIEIGIGTTLGNVKIFVDDIQIGLIQEINCKASVNSPFAEVEIVFPDFSDEKYLNDTWAKSVKESVKLLEEFPNIKISYKKMF